MKIRIALPVIALVILSACNTVGGVARDTYGAAKFVTNQVTSDE